MDNLSLVEKWRPRDFKDFVGLKAVKRMLNGFISRPHSQAFLFCGPPGTGKTTMARVLADRLNFGLVHVESQGMNVDRVESLKRQTMYYPPEGKLGYLVLCDECDSMSHAAQYALLSMLDSSANLKLQFGGTSIEGNRRLPVIFVFTCNGTGSDGCRPPETLDGKFLSRCLALKFETTEIKKELKDYLRIIWENEGGNGQPDFGNVVEDIVFECQGQVRDALQALELRLLDADFDSGEELIPPCSARRKALPETAGMPEDANGDASHSALHDTGQGQIRAAPPSGPDQKVFRLTPFEERKKFEREFWAERGLG